MQTGHRATPIWMPPEQTLSVVAAGRWWDAIVIPQRLGLDALQLLDQGTGHCPGPVIWDPRSPRPRLYFLVAEGSAAKWSLPDATALGLGSHIGIPGPTRLEPPGPHWLCPPDPDDRDALVDADALGEALRTILGGCP